MIYVLLGVIILLGLSLPALAVLHVRGAREGDGWRRRAASLEGTLVWLRAEYEEVAAEDRASHVRWVLTQVDAELARGADPGASS